MQGNNHHFKRRLAPGTPLELELAQESGQALKLSLKLAFDFNAIAALEKETGLNMMHGHEKEVLTCTHIGAFFWASLLTHQPEFGEPGMLEVARSYIDLSSLNVISEAVFNAYQQYARPTTPAIPEATQPGSSSGASAVMTSA